MRAAIITSFSLRFTTRWANQISEDIKRTCSTLKKRKQKGNEISGESEKLQRTFPHQEHPGGGMSSRRQQRDEAWQHNLLMGATCPLQGWLEEYHWPPRIHTHWWHVNPCKKVTMERRFSTLWRRTLTLKEYGKKCLRRANVEMIAISYYSLCNKPLTLT